MGAVADDPPFARIGIVGLGLIGGSIALGVRTAWPQVRLLAVDRPEVLEMALARGAIDDGRETVGALGGLDALILAAPIGQNVAALEALPEVLGGEMVVTDVGSTKRRMLEAAVGLPPRLDFVPGHPLGGAARSGFAHARGTLFHERPWILTPRAGAPEPAVTRVEALARGLGARPMREELRYTRSHHLLQRPEARRVIDLDSRQRSWVGRSDLGSRRQVRNFAIVLEQVG
jgi:prephenate dehydrogenase